jgi:hypothetical protein
LNTHSRAYRTRESLDGDWRISSFCTNGTCIEVRLDGGVIQVRDSVNPDGPVLHFSQAEWRASLAGIIGGELRATADSPIAT